VRYFPTSKYDKKTASEILALPWMLNLLKLNPSYCSWGPGEDYMKGESKEGGWDSSVIVKSWKEFQWELNDLNELVNFYFEVERANKRCLDCNGDGYNPATLEISRQFYDFENTGKRWVNKITQDEVLALVKENRLMDFTHTWTPEKGWEKKSPEYIPSAAEVNEWSYKAFGHDAINRHILIQARATRLGVFGHCAQCQGNGYTYTSSEAAVALVLWILHPRKGCSRGVVVNNIEECDLPEVFEFLQKGAKRNAQRFSKVIRKSNQAKQVKNS
jgi:hypothetical protein